MPPMRSRDTSEQALRAQLDVYRRLLPSQRLRVGLELTETSRRLLAAGIRRRHPEYSDDQLRLALIRAWLGPELFRRAYAGAPELEP